MTDQEVKGSSVHEIDIFLDIEPWDQRINDERGLVWNVKEEIGLKTHLMLTHMVFHLLFLELQFRIIYQNHLLVHELYRILGQM